MTCRSGRMVEVLCTGSELTLFVRDVWALDHICTSMGTLLRASPGIRSARIHLADVPAIDRSALASLQYAVLRLTAAGVAVRFEGCSPPVARMLAGQHAGQPGVDGAVIGLTPEADAPPAPRRRPLP